LLSMFTCLGMGGRLKWLPGLLYHVCVRRQVLHPVRDELKALNGVSQHCRQGSAPRMNVQRTVYRGSKIKLVRCESDSGEVAWPMAALVGIEVKTQPLWPYISGRRLGIYSRGATQAIPTLDCDIDVRHLQPAPRPSSRQAPWREACSCTCCFCRSACSCAGKKRMPTPSRKAGLVAP
jgi:hypothetical protein